MFSILHCLLFAFQLNYLLLCAKSDRVCVTKIVNGKFVTEGECNQNKDSSAFIEKLKEDVEKKKSTTTDATTIISSTTGSLTTNTQICDPDATRQPPGRTSICRGGNLTADDQIQTFYSHPEYGCFPYINYFTCDWTIYADDGYGVNLTFIDFQLESEHSCNFDYVEIYDRNTCVNEDNKIGKYCDLNKPETTLSTSNSIFVKFYTDMSIVFRGFSVEYSRYRLHKTCTVGNLTAVDEIKTLYSHPKYGCTSYSNNIECIWMVYADIGYGVNLTFIDFQLENHMHCIYDYVEVYDGMVEDANKIGKYCHVNKPEPILSTSNTMFIKFYTNVNIAFRGFSAEYSRYRLPQT